MSKSFKNEIYNKNQHVKNVLKLDNSRNARKIKT
jgi:hypothetical protein